MTKEKDKQFATTPHPEGYDPTTGLIGMKMDFDEMAGRNKPSIEDYRFCITCNTVFDFWKYNYDLEDAGHEPPCEVRMLTPEEYEEALKECDERECF